MKKRSAPAPAPRPTLIEQEEQRSHHPTTIMSSSSVHVKKRARISVVGGIRSQRKPDAMDLLLQAIDTVSPDVEVSGSLTTGTCSTTNSKVIVDRVPSSLHRRHDRLFHREVVPVSSQSSTASLSASSAVVLLPLSSKVVGVALPPLDQCRPLGAPPSLPTFLKPGQILLGSNGKKLGAIRTELQQ